MKHWTVGSPPSSSRSCDGGSHGRRQARRAGAVRLAATRRPNSRSMTWASTWASSTPPNETMLDDSRLTQSWQSPDAPTLVAGLDETSRRMIRGQRSRHQPTELLPLGDCHRRRGATSRVRRAGFRARHDATAGRPASAARWPRPISAWISTWAARAAGRWRAPAHAAPGIERRASEVDPAVGRTSSR